jgi:hypothetical protein
MSNKNCNRIIIYYQTLIDLNPLIELIKTKTDPILTDITLASIHFGVNSDGSPYIHLNDDSPSSNKFDTIFTQLKKLKSENQIKLNLLIGGAGTAFNQLFKEYDCYYNLLKTSLKNELNFIDGFNLDIEEDVDINNIIKLVNDLKNDFPNKQIIFAPLAESITTDNPGMGGFSYKILNNKIGDKIDYYNVQCYGEYSESLFNQMVENGYPSDKLVMGMLSGQNLNNIIQELEKIVDNVSYNKFGGVAVWEYYDAPPSSPEHPYVWCEIMSHILNLN